MNPWCESCARKNQCYTVDIKPKCYVPITNTDRTESTFVDKAIEAYSKGFTDGTDAIKDIKDKPQTCSVSGRPYSECADCEHFRCTADEPQTETSTNNSTISEKFQLKDEQSGKE